MRRAWAESGLPPARMAHVKKANVPDVDIQCLSVFREKMGCEGIARMIPTNCSYRHSDCERHHFGEQYYWRIWFDRVG